MIGATEIGYSEAQWHKLQTKQNFEMETWSRKKLRRPLPEEDHRAHLELEEETNLSDRESHHTSERDIEK